MTSDQMRVGGVARLSPSSGVRRLVVTVSLPALSSTSPTVPERITPLTS